MGDVASFRKYLSQNGVTIDRDNYGATALSRNALTGDADCVIYVTAKNNVGDPVINEVMFMCENATDVTHVFLNCDLSDKVTTGIAARGLRDAFRASIQPLYYFSPLTLAARPLLLPVEQGSLLFTFGRVQENTAVNASNDLETRRHGVYEVYKVLPEDVGDDSCSLNRFMRMKVYRCTSTSPTGAVREYVSRPRFRKVLEASRLPSRDDISSLFGT
eukprot:gene24006-29053_t